MSEALAPDPGAAGNDMRINEAAWDITASARLQETLRALREGKTDQWTMDEFVHYMKFYKRFSEKTVNGYRWQLDFMGRHPIAPVKLHGSRAELIETFSMYITAREQLDGLGHSALHTDHGAIRALGAFLSIPDNVWPTAPRAVRTESRWVPSPEQVFELLQASFGPRRSYEHHLTRYMLAFTFGFGVRAPSELLPLKVTDVDLDHAIIIVTEPKKGGPRRELVVEPRWLCDSPNRLSLRRWIEGPRNLCNPQTDALFPNVDGRAFPTREAIARFLERSVHGDKRRGDPDPFPWYQNYVARHWSCNARLIDAMRVVEGQKVFDWNACARWHGHESVKMTMSTYARAVEINERKYGRNWLSRAFGGRDSRSGK